VSIGARSEKPPALFAPTSHPLSVGLLRPPTMGEARELGQACAAIEPWSSLGYEGQALGAYLERPDPSLFRFAILWDGRAAGVLALRWPWLRGPFIEMLAVLPSHQGRGLAGAALSWATARTASATTNLWATVSDFHTPARAFWKHQGFEEIAELPGLIGEGSEILLRKRVAPRP
jgi:GNAT superfamily N-acetyltransferase